MIKRIRSVFGFLTIIPVGTDLDIEDTAKNAWLFPIAGGFIGAIAACVFAIFNNYFSDSISSAIALFALLTLTGFHHLDGLLDFGDGLMRIGSAKARRNAMHDINTGVGGFAFGFFVLLLTYLALSETTLIFTSLIVAEASAKFSMVLGAFAGKTSHEGMGSIFAKSVNTKMFLLTLIVYFLFLGILPLDKAVVVFVTAATSSLLITAISTKLFSGTSGDVMGTINEITRAGVLVVLLL